MNKDKFVGHNLDHWFKQSRRDGQYMVLLRFKSGVARIANDTAVNEGKQVIATGAGYFGYPFEDTEAQDLSKAGIYHKELM
ncbi:hypothetical protein FRC03_005835 [Tulasnella sp. 419]|nr:hypothetical protein FRC03_005835 [Tulasnella sp. 419]